MLTRSQVAARLGVSLSTVRRFEGDRLHPTVGPDNVRLFDPKEVAALAAELLATRPAGERRNPKPRGAAASREPTLSRGELAGAVFEKLEERHSLAEIVVALRVPPEVVRELHHEWLIGLLEGELARAKPAVASEHEQRVRFADQATLTKLLSELPTGTRTRISLARDLGARWVNDDVGEVRAVAELGGFIVTGPIGPADIVERYGARDFRVTAYCLEPRECLWEVFVTLT